MVLDPPLWAPSLSSGLTTEQFSPLPQRPTQFILTPCLSEVKSLFITVHNPGNGTHRLKNPKTAKNNQQPNKSLHPLFVVSNLRNIVFNQKSPFHSISEFRRGPLSVTNNQTQNKHRTIFCLLWNTAVTHMFIIFKMWEILKTWKLGLIRRPNSRSCEGLRLSDNKFVGPSVKFNLFWQILTKLQTNSYKASYKLASSFIRIKRHILTFCLLLLTRLGRPRW